MRYVLMFCYKETPGSYYCFDYYCFEGIRYPFRSREEALKKAKEMAKTCPDKIIYVSMVMDSVQTHEPIEHHSFVK